MIDTIAITEATPITMPSVVRKLLNAWARIESSAARAPSLAANHTDTRVLAERLWPTALIRASLGLLAIVFEDLAVLEPNHALAVRGHVGLVGHEDDRVAVGVQLVEQPEDFDRRLRIEVSG